MDQAQELMIRKLCSQGSKAQQLSGSSQELGLTKMILCLSRWKKFQDLVLIKATSRWRLGMNLNLSSDLQAEIRILFTQHKQDSTQVQELITAKILWVSKANQSPWALDVQTPLLSRVRTHQAQAPTTNLNSIKLLSNLVLAGLVPQEGTLSILLISQIQVLKLTKSKTQTLCWRENLDQSLVQLKDPQCIPIGTYQVLANIKFLRKL